MTAVEPTATPATAPAPAAADGAGNPDPFVEIRMKSLSATRGANYWSRRAVTRIDLTLGAYDEISSAESPDFTERLVAALPGLEEHRCSIGERGGFITRLNRGTYAPHIVEHVALELQSMIGHDVGYGRSRGGDVDGDYTVVFEHVHEATGLRAAALALATVQQAFAGTLAGVEHAVAELAAIAATPDVPPITPHVLCGVTGGSARAEARSEIARIAGGEAELIVDVSPGFIMQAGLPYAESDYAIVVDTALVDVPERYQDPERAERLVTVLVDGLRDGGLLIAPAKCWALQDAARQQGCRVAVFSGANDVTSKDRKVARSAAWVDGDQIVLEHRGRRARTLPLRDGISPAVQAAAALFEFAIEARRV